MPLLSKKSPAAFGLLLCLAALYRCATLSGSGWDHLLVPLAMLSLLILALLLLKRAGFSENALAAALFPLGLAFFLRAFLMPCVTSDYQNFLSHWVEYFRQNGGFLALKDPVGNYNVPYLYMLAALSHLPLNDLYGIKLFSILFDVLLAWGGLRLARTRTADRSVWLITFFSLLLLPTVILNGACWGQCDSVWAALCLHALACALEDKPVPSLVLLALAFSFKLQAIFLIPLWAAFWFAGKLRTHELFAFPLAFFLSISPALMLGKPLGAILSIYLEQAGDSVAWQTVNYNWPFWPFCSSAESILTAPFIFWRRPPSLWASPFSCPICMSGTSFWGESSLWSGPASGPDTPRQPPGQSWPLWAAITPI